MRTEVQRDSSLADWQSASWAWSHNANLVLGTVELASVDVMVVGITGPINAVTGRCSEQRNRHTIRNFPFSHSESLLQVLP